MYDASVIVPTYNRIEALELSLEAYKRQSVKNFEIIVADDGSTRETADFLESMKKSYPFPLKHVWQEDAGFRKARISNMAIARAESEYLIFSDADCIPHKDFIAGHLSLAEKGSYLIGRSVKMSAKISNALDISAIAKGTIEGVNLNMFYDYIFGMTKFLEYGVYVKSELILKLIARFRKARSLFGYNFSAWRDDMIKVNGFDEDFIMPNNEDGELGFRLSNIGLTPKIALGRTISYHYHHDRSHATRSQANVDRATHARISGLTRCENGLDKHLAG